MAGRLSAAMLEGMRGGETRWDAEVRGFGARRQTDDGRIAFVLKYVAPGTRRQRFVTIGPWSRGDWSLDAARKRATGLRDAVRLGRDPAEERDTKKAMLTVGELCDFLHASCT